MSRLLTLFARIWTVNIPIRIEQKDLAEKQKYSRRYNSCNTTFCLYYTSVTSQKPKLNYDLKLIMGLYLSWFVTVKFEERFSRWLFLDFLSGS